MSKEGILAIGECYAMNYLLHTVLSKDFPVTCARSCSEAFYELRRDLNKKIVILDISSTESASFELLENLNSSALLKDIRIIILSDTDDELFKLKTKELGGIYFLTKPFDPLYLSRLIKNLTNFGDYNGFLKRTTDSKNTVLLSQFSS